jgi:hypothetical protein
VGGELVDDVLATNDVVRVIHQQRDPWALVFGEVDLALHLGVEHAQQEVHAGFAVVFADCAHVGVDDQDVSGLDDAAE